MSLKFWVVLMLMAIAMVTKSTIAEPAVNGSNSTRKLVGDEINEDEEMMVDSEATHRLLAGRRKFKKFLSYDVLKANATPCKKRGNSYYGCRVKTKANPYRRGCSVITLCYRYTH
ncbi:hypothetical protein JCGZ_03994 [Jatropha curcas]|uniref:Rapid ALkalinization Factor n=1 Tax=Jatropha curcas TaxID=180498 RepID=A0A067KQZ3_JATCU|nr:hypothetical protein JCGZ_03994 [Jatropha curcas]